jgi:hypothetical protein
MDPDIPQTALLRTYQARYDLGYRWVRHSSEAQGWAALVESPAGIELEDMTPNMEDKVLWDNAGCRGEATNSLLWWVNKYSEGTYPPDTGEPIYLHQIWHLDIVGPGGAGWRTGTNPNRWTGDYFAFTGIFADPVESGRCIYGSVEGEPILPAWRNYAQRTAEIYGTQADTLGGHNQAHARFKRWMIFNEPFMRGLFPWNTVTLFREAKAGIRQTGAAGTIYIGGTSNGLDDKSIGEHNKIPLNLLERQFALFAYGAGEVADGLQNESIGIHIFAGGAPESPFICSGSDFYGRNKGMLQKCDSAFSLGRFWGMDPVRVTVDESVIMPDTSITYSNPAEVQANYVERTLLLALASGYLDAIHISFADGCKSEDGQLLPSPRPGIAAHRFVSEEDPEIIKPGYYAATLFDQVMGDAAFESSIPVYRVDRPQEPDPDLYCLRFRSVSDPRLAFAALWSSSPDFDEETQRTVTARVQVASSEPMDLYYRIPSDTTSGWYKVCNESVWIPRDPGGIHHEVVTDFIQEEPGGPIYLDLPLSGAPLYLVSRDNHVRQAEGSFEVATIAGLRGIGDSRVHQLYEIAIQIEELRTADDELRIEFPAEWIPPQIDDPEQPGYVSVGTASHTLQTGESNFEIGIQDGVIWISPADTLWPGCQLSILYGDYRHAARLLDMGPWESGPVDLDFLKLTNWMTADSSFDYRSNEGGNNDVAPDYVVPPKAGWKVLPTDEDVLGDELRRVKKVWGHAPTSIYRDYNGMVFRNSSEGNPRKDTQTLVLRDLTPGRLYDVIIYLNNQESDFEECVSDPESGFYCPGKKTKAATSDTVYTLYLPDLTKQQVRVDSADLSTLMRDSSEDRVFRIPAGSDGVLEVVFKHAGDNQGRIPDESQELDNMIYCYGVDLHPAALGGGPTESATSGAQVFTYKINEAAVATATIDLNPDYGVPSLD